MCLQAHFRTARLSPTESREIAVVYVAVVPRLEFRLARQRYSQLGGHPGGDRYLYESLESEFKAELLVDAHDLVIDYPGVWEQVDPVAAVKPRRKG
jgi:hypothetical protein